MPRHLFKFFFPASGGARVIEGKNKSIRLARYGCTNRPFYHIVVIHTRMGRNDHPIEQLGTFDPSPNEYHEKLVSLNIERIRYWLGTENIHITDQVRELFGLAGLFPIYHRTYMKAWKNRATAEAEIEKQKQEKLKQEQEEKEESKEAAGSG
uniref:Small ribosomal subunit protein bS16m n=1 Tax=Cacopsylla melanoneura TaxID=428564 RepID=A0A8D8RHN6_9HEMI